jgi:haloacetate dehalogenase
VRGIAIEGAEIAATVAGKGPPVLLLHGFPQTRACWRKIIPGLIPRFTVVAPDLRGVGDSRPAVLDQSKRALARDAVAAMASLGFDRFAVVGHDRGARVAYRLALDAPEKVSQLCVLDIIPTGEMWALPREQLLRRSPHWPALAEPEAEARLRADPAYLERTLRLWAGDFSAVEDAMPEYLRTWDASIAAWCADYRAGATVDDEHDRADQVAGRHIRSPMLALWSRGPDGDPLAVWRRWADEVRGKEFDCGHFLPEEAPDAVLAELESFLAVSMSRRTQ